MEFPMQTRSKTVLVELPFWKFANRGVNLVDLNVNELEKGTSVDETLQYNQTIVSISHESVDFDH